MHMDDASWLQPPKFLHRKSTTAYLERVPRPLVSQHTVRSSRSGIGHGVRALIDPVGFSPMLSVPGV